ncbi:protein SMG8 isoform X3 [Cimex lectularius]|uniref:Nonsense-mediated mRNA decay factor SMG8 n=1 Tax=Cimex lectularius TaxID=79782 RepID=A0A8I6RKQ2_CIMLE|nr:protein SMG8 isoform X3 [Cimex lectularius]
MEWKFRLPAENLFKFFSEEELSDQVVIVSFFGKTSILDDYPTIFGFTLDDNDNYNRNIDDEETDCCIEGYYAANEKVLYLFLVGAFNPRKLANLFKESANDLKEKGFLYCWNNFKCSYVKGLLFLFSLSHIIVICHPRETLDLSVVQFLKVLSRVRPSYQSIITNIISDLEEFNSNCNKTRLNNDLQHDLLIHGRICCPRLLFVFECPFDILNEDDEERAARTTKLEHALEDQIYLTLRRSRLVKNVCNRAFFSIAPNDEFVFVQNNIVSESRADRSFRRLMEKLEDDSNISNDGGVNATATDDDDDDENFSLLLDINSKYIPSSNETELDSMWRRKPGRARTVNSAQETSPQKVQQLPEWASPGHTWSMAMLEDNFSHLSTYSEPVSSFDCGIIEKSYGDLGDPNVYEMPTHSIDVFTDFNPWSAAGIQGQPGDPYYEACMIPHTALEEYYLRQYPPEEQQQFVNEGLGCIITGLPEPPIQYCLNDGRPLSECSIPSSSTSSSCSVSFASFEETLHHGKNYKSGHRFKTFLQKHIRKAHNDGFYDNMGKYINVKPFFMRPSLKYWLEIASGLSRYSMLGVKQTEATNEMKSLLGTELQFSSARCKKIIPLAVSRYQENLPPHYNRAIHEKQVKKAIIVFTHHARGPEQDKYITELKIQCDNLWKSGRQTCEMQSLSKNTCTWPAHQCLNKEFDKILHRELQILSINSGMSFEKNPLKILTRFRKININKLILRESEHWSGIQYISSCNCGVKQGNRPDPFTLKAANYSFYRDIGKECGCIHLDHINFPVFQPSIHDYKAADVNAYGYNQENSSSSINTLANLYHESVQASFSVENIKNVAAFCAGKLWTPDHLILTLHEGTPTTPPLSDQSGNLVLDYFSPQSQDKHLVRQASTTEYLPGMLHFESPHGLLPQFPSWSLLCRGPSSLYSHNLGLHDQPGFILGSSFLLPWDVTIKEHDVISNISPDLKKIPSATFCRGGYKKFQRYPKDFINVKIFIGVEYECLRGHRFMSSAPGKILKVSANGIVKENANKLTKGNMPLYLPCPCSKSLAQLMRIHVVTPKAPVFVTIDPKVRPAPPPCPIFITGDPKPIALSQSTYWVLRLPFVYASERNVYTTPTRLKKLKYGELIGPTYGITQITE